MLKKLKGQALKQEKHKKLLKLKENILKIKNSDLTSQCLSNKFAILQNQNLKTFTHSETLASIIQLISLPSNSQTPSLRPSSKSKFTLNLPAPGSSLGPHSTLGSASAPKLSLPKRPNVSSELPGNSYGSFASPPSFPSIPNAQPASQASFPPANQPSFPPANQPSYPPASQPSYPPASQPSYPPANQPSFSPYNPAFSSTMTPPSYPYFQPQNNQPNPYQTSMVAPPSFPSPILKKAKAEELPMDSGIRNFDGK